MENSFASVLLFGFHLQNIDGQGELDTGASDAGAPINYAVVGNHPVAVQVQTTLDFLAQFLERQSAIIDTIDDESADASDVVQRTTAADTIATAATADELRFGWREAARSLGRRAGELGLRLDVAYEPTFAPVARDWARRVRLLRRTYNDHQGVRAHVDRIVYAITGRQSRMHGGSEQVRIFAQQWSVLASPEKFFAQALRDGLVLGNGFVGFSETAPFGAYALRPEQWRPLRHDTAVPLTEAKDDRARRVIHFKGFDQPDTELGLGIGELLLPFLAQHEVIAHAIAAMQQYADAIPQAAHTLKRYRQLAKAQETAKDQRVSELLGWWQDHVPDPPDDLYLPGHELIR